MQFDWQTHFDRVVIPSWRAFLTAEDRLSAAVVAQDAALIDHESYEALREGGAAAIYLHHFTEIAWDRRAHFLAAGLNGVGDVRGWLATMCYAGRSNTLVADFELLRDIADALKHATLTRQNPAPRVPANNRVITVGTGYGGHSLWRGQVWWHRRPRALSGILQNVVDAWRTAMGIRRDLLPQPGV
jgi:hypothetical protein